MRNRFGWAVFALLVVLLTTTLVNADIPAIGGLSQGTQQLGTAFMYQGHLEFTDGAVTGSCDLRFELFNNADGGNQIGETNLAATIVEQGHFSVELDFGDGAFDGGSRYIEIGVGCPAGEDIVTLSPRQTISPAPYAIYAAKAGSAPWDGLEQVPDGFTDGDDADLLSALDCEQGQYPLMADVGWECFDVGASLTVIDTEGFTQAHAMATGVLAYLTGPDGLNTEELRMVTCNDRRCSSPSTTVLTEDAKTPISMAISSDGMAFVAFRGASDSHLRMARCSSPDCENVSVVTIDDRLTGRNSLGTTSGGRPVLAYSLGGTTLGVAVCEDSSCVSRTGTEVSLAGTLGRLSVAATPINPPVIAFVEEFDLERHIRLVLCNDFNCSQTTVMTVDNTLVDGGQVELDVTIGGDGLPLVAALVLGGPKNTRHLQLYHCLDALCSANTSSSNLVASGNSVNKEIDLVTGSDGYGVLVVPIRSSIVGLAKCLNADCTSLTTSPTGIAYSEVLMTNGSDGAPLMGYITADRTISIVHCASAYSCGD